MRSVWLLAVCVLSFCAVAFSLKEFDLVFPKIDAYNSPRAMLLETYNRSTCKIPTDAFTFAFFVFVEEPNSASTALISYSSKEKGNYDEIYMETEFDVNGPYTALYINYVVMIFPKVPVIGNWTHVCISWASATNEFHLFLNGVEVDGKVRDDWTKDNLKGYKIGGDGFFVFGNDQDGYNGYYDPGQGLIGRMAGFEIWDRVLSEKEVNDVMSCNMSGEVVDWANSQWGLYDGITMQPSTSPCAKPCITEFKTAPEVDIPAPPEVEVTCDEANGISPYDLKYGYFADGTPHRITATLALPELKSFTMCFWLSGKLGNIDMTPIQITNKDGDPLMEVIKDRRKSRELFFKVGGEKNGLDGVQFREDSYPICLTWSSVTGHIVFYIDAYRKDVLEATGKNFVFPADSKLVITQEQKAPLDPKFPAHGFIYKISDFYMWNRQLPEVEVYSFFNCSGSVGDYIITPKETKWDIKDHGPSKKD